MAKKAKRSAEEVAEEISEKVVTAHNLMEDLEKFVQEARVLMDTPEDKLVLQFKTPVDFERYTNDNWYKFNGITHQIWILNYEMAHSQRIKDLRHTLTQIHSAARSSIDIAVKKAKAFLPRSTYQPRTTW